MAANGYPRFTKNGKFGPVAVTAANTSSEGGGTIGGGTPTMFLMFSPDTTNGSYVEKIRCFPTASAASTATTATVARIFLSTVSSGSTTSANTWLIAEATLPSVTADSSTAAVNPIDIPLGITVPSNYFLLVSNHAAPAASTQWIFTAFAGDY